LKKKWLVIGPGILLLAGTIIAFQVWQSRHVANAIATADWDRTYLAASKDEPGAMDMLRAQSNTKERQDVTYALGEVLVWSSFLPDYQRKGLPYTAAQVEEWGAREAEARKKLEDALWAERKSR
jgi:hypothetical protein